MNKALSQWYAVQTRSNFEKHTCVELHARGVEHYCPAFREVHQWADRKKVVERPLFPGYVFARFSDSGALRLRILQAPGAVRILGGEKIEAIPDEEIDSIRKLLNSGRQCTAHPFLREGSWVRVRRGALKNVEGTLIRVKNETRLVLSIALLCKSVATEVDIADVEVVRPIL